MTGVIYARYFSDNQREESIESQLRECKAFAEKNDIQIVGTYIDRELSAKTDNRPDFQRMIKDSSGGKFDIVLVWKTVLPVTVMTPHITNPFFVSIRMVSFFYTYSAIGYFLTISWDKKIYIFPRFLIKFIHIVNYIISRSCLIPICY